MLAWPRSSWTYFGCLPAMRSIVAQVWRRSWSLTGGSSALFKRGLKWRPRRLVPLHGGARDGREDEAVVLPEGAHPEPLFVLVVTQVPTCCVSAEKLAPRRASASVGSSLSLEGSMTTSPSVLYGATARSASPVWR